MLYSTDDDLVVADLEIVYQKELSECDRLTKSYESKLAVNPLLNRQLISFQANKIEPFYRWFKYKEGFSTSFVKHILSLFGKPNGKQVVLDPFSGIGTTLTTSNECGFDAIGIELLPHAILAINARVASKSIDKFQIEAIIEQLKSVNFSDKTVEQRFYFQHLTITRGAFSGETEINLANFRKFLLEQSLTEEVRSLLSLIAISILEDVSFTRKDGQYLRWDSRSSRKLKSTFSKGTIYQFKEKLFDKLDQIKVDLNHERKPTTNNKLNLIQGSCLTKLQEIKTGSVDLVITSPPYCNRYDYTRTYALELAFTGVDDQAIKDLRQTLLSATVENRSKFNEIELLYKGRKRLKEFKAIAELHKSHPALNEIIENLNSNRESLNNTNIPQMISNYFFEMNFVIHELSRTLKKGGKVIMVNDNVQYNGNEVPVDLILSDFANAAGLNTDTIWLLEKGKGNSSQQMGIHGRNEIRKCVYVWSKN